MIRLVTVASVISTYQKPAITVDTNDDAQTDLWASRLNVSRDRLLAAISEVGPSLAAVRHYLAK
ncbi:DUF3606 domain-containing protein [Nitrobacter hamburgensis]|jgi:hypothetical protein|uniref:DUF3606 domain-containing protein n=1 Tax=Nitrobacter hamburgensis TaxID=912 RepID=UPI00059C57B0|nr:DUF3606 domain-containing protein [Nitrobacter hamburgensis]